MNRISGRWLHNRSGNKLISSFSLCALVLTALLASTANAVENGTSALGDIKVVAAQLSGSRSPFCSAALLSEYIVVSAAHCFTDNTGNENSPISTALYTVSLPGVDVLTDDLSTRVNVMKIVVVAGYDNIWKPDQNDTRTQKDDIAFLFLEKPLVPKYQIEVATPFEVSQLKANHSPLTHYGYGFQSKDKQDAKPYKITLNASKRNGNEIVDYEKMISTEEIGGALCPGDSGGPSYAEINGTTKLVGDTVGAGGCLEGLRVGDIDLHTLTFPYLELVKQEWEKYAQEKKITYSPVMAFNAIEVNKAQEKTYADLVAPVIGLLVRRDFVSSCCHSKGAKMVLEIKKNDTWSDFKPASGFLPSSVDESNVGSALLTADVPIGSYVRWHIFVKGSFDYYGQPERISVSGVGEVHKVLQASLLKKTTITCIKGKSTKKVTAVKPVCPKGYKKK